MEQEPISVRIARAKGCEPRIDPDALYALWYCPCGGGKGHRADEGYPFLVSNSSEQWLTPAASFALLAELNEALWGADVFVCPLTENGDESGKILRPIQRRYGCRIEVGDDQRTGPEFEEFMADSLPEAIATAWLAWKAQG